VSGIGSSTLLGNLESSEVHRRYMSITLVCYTRASINQLHQFIRPHKTRLSERVHAHDAACAVPRKRVEDTCLLTLESLFDSTIKEVSQPIMQGPLSCPDAQYISATSEPYINMLWFRARWESSPLSRIAGHGCREFLRMYNYVNYVSMHNYVM
jgi:hypothetical protein